MHDATDTTPQSRRSFLRQAGLAVAAGLGLAGVVAGRARATIGQCCPASFGSCGDPARCTPAVWYRCTCPTFSYCECLCAGATCNQCTPAGC